MKDYSRLIEKLNEMALNNEAYHKEWVILEMEESGCSIDEAEKRFTIARQERGLEVASED